MILNRLPRRWSAIGYQGDYYQSRPAAAAAAAEKSPAPAGESTVPSAAVAAPEDDPEPARA